MLENTILIIGGVVCIAGILLGIAFVEVKARVSKVVIDWLDGSYERSLHIAISEVQKTEKWTDACLLWRENYELIAHLRLHWLTQVRKRLATIHRTKENKFERAVQIITDPDNITLHLRPWTITRLNVDGSEVGSFSDVTVTRCSTEDTQALQTWFNTWRGADALMITDHNGKVVRTVQRGDSFPNEAPQVSASNS